jgi:hypothetical protein
MKLIPNFTMTPFSQMVWLSLEAKERWEKPIQACAQMVQELEILSVEHGHRACAWQTMGRALLPEFSKRCAEKGLIVLPVRFVGSFDGFVHYTPPGDGSVYCIVSKSLKDALLFRGYFENGDHAGQGEMLGFPKCCREAFAVNWKAGYFDPIWQMDGRDEPHPYSNPLLRCIGLRVGFHIPHSFNCAYTIAAGLERLSLAKDRGLVKVLESLLSMPMSWDAYKGQAIIKTPIFYHINYTVPTLERYRIELPGTFMPREAVPGNCYPLKGASCAAS